MAALSILTDVLRIITPEEISELTTSYSGKTRVDLTDLLEHVESGNPLEFKVRTDSAKILPFINKGEDQAESGKENLEDKGSSSISASEGTIEYVTHFLHVKKLGETSKSKSGDTVETAIFIIKEKERFKYVQGKLKKKEVMGLYMKNAGVDIEQEKTLKEDLSKSSRSGVLVNKKQY